MDLTAPNSDDAKRQALYRADWSQHQGRWQSPYSGHWYDFVGACRIEGMFAQLIADSLTNMKTRAAAKWHVQVLPAVKRQWYIRIKRGGEVISVGETRRTKRATIATAKGIVADMKPGKAVFDDLTRLSELPNGMWEF